MRRPVFLIVALGIAVVVMAIAFVNFFPRLANLPVRKSPPDQPVAVEPDADAISANNRGVGLMGRYEYDNAREVFAELVEAYPDWLQARINLAIATLNRQREGDERAALAMLDEVLEQSPDHLQAQYVSGLLRLYLDEPDRAMEHFVFVANADETDPYAAYYVAQSNAQRGNYEEALKWYERALELDPYLRSGYYGIFQVMQRLQRQEEAMEMLDTFQRLADNPRARLVDFVYTRMGPKGEAIAEGLEAVQHDPPPSGPIFAHPVSLLINGESFNWTIRRDDRPVSITACDITGNGHLDIFIANALDEDGVYNAVCINQGDNTFAVDVDHPLARISDVNAALWGDFDNDGLTDVYLCRTGPNMLWRQVAENQWEDVTASTGTANGSFDSVDGLFFDADHDGDLDIFVVNFDGPNELLNNNRDGTFTPIAQEQGIAGDGRASRQVIAVDLEGDRDLDIIVINEQPPHEVYLNDRLWRYRPMAELDERGRPTRYSNLVKAEIIAMVKGDIDADGRSQLVTFNADRHIFLWEPGIYADVLRPVVKYGYTLGPEQLAPTAQLAISDVTGDASLEVLYGGAGAWLAQPLPQGGSEILYLAQQRALAGWTNVTLHQHNGPAIVGLPTDGGPPLIWRPGPGRHAFTTVSFTGKEDVGQSMRSNASGIGTYFAARIGSRWVAGNTLPSHSGPGQSLQPIAIGLGGASKIDFMHIDWSDGIFQSELDLAAGEHHLIPETQRQLSSCPVLWAWNGEKYEFISDVLGVGGIGFLTGAPGEYAPSRPWERFLFPQGVLKPKQGRYHIKLGEPMEEACYLDSARMVVYDLPPGWHMTLDERMHISGPAPTGETKFYRQFMLPSRAVNDRGEDVTDIVREANLQAAPVGELDRRFIGRLLQDHVLTLTFGHPLDAGPGEPVLIADGWVEYPYSQTAFAAWQAGADYEAPTIEVRDADGQWHTLLEHFGYPAGMPRQMSVPLSDLPAGSNALRISTNQEIYWDRLMIAWVEPAPEDMQRTQLELLAATLSRSGFAQRAELPQRLPYYDYNNRVPLWDTRHQAGWYTRFGRVEQIIREANHALAIFGPGEEIHMEFGALMVDPQRGWTRHHVLESDGWCKDMDLFTLDGETLDPLPGDESPERIRFHSEFNTRYESGR